MTNNDTPYFFYILVWSIGSIKKYATKNVQSCPALLCTTCTYMYKIKFISSNGVFNVGTHCVWCGAGLKMQ
jgi:hypothetical protein